MVRRLNFTVVWRILWAGSRRIIDVQIRSVGIDLGKTTFHLVALGDNGKVLLKKKGKVSNEGKSASMYPTFRWRVFSWP
jgi:hypothetical protein